jgi:hypothetical protein
MPIDPGALARLNALQQIIATQVTQSSIADAKFVGLLGINVLLWQSLAQPFRDTQHNFEVGHLIATALLVLSAIIIALGLLIPRASVYLKHDPLANSAVIPEAKEIEVATILYRREVKHNEYTLGWKGNIMWLVIGLSTLGAVVGALTTTGLGAR